MFSLVYRLQITEKPNPAEKEPPSEIKAHIKIMSTKLFSMDSSVPHKQSVWGITTPLFCTHVKMFFLLQNAEGKGIGFLEKALACLTAPERKE